MQRFQDVVSSVLILLSIGCYPFQIQTNLRNKTHVLILGQVLQMGGGCAPPNRHAFFFKNTCAQASAVIVHSFFTICPRYSGSLVNLFIMFREIPLFLTVFHHSAAFASFSSFLRALQSFFVVFTAACHYI